nr:2-amino-4-hydroxy-6-hydroxymethyldihydropteridine diphosphokinase [Rhodococcus sp. HNM0569]
MSIGSNIGDSRAHLASVLTGLAPHVVAVSSAYRTAPWGGVDQQDFLNAIVVVDDPATDCRGWLGRAQQLERDAERVRDVRWGPRTLDVDIVVCRDADGVDVRSDDPELTLPHPRAHERAFVLVPWLEVEPDAELVVDGRAVRVDAALALLDADERDGVRADGPVGT